MRMIFYKLSLEKQRKDTFLHSPCLTVGTLKRAPSMTAYTGQECMKKKWGECPLFPLEAWHGGNISYLTSFSLLSVSHSPLTPNTEQRVPRKYCSLKPAVILYTVILAEDHHPHRGHHLLCRHQCVDREEIKQLSQDHMNQDLGFLT